MTSKVPVFVMNNGIQMPGIALGTCFAKEDEVEQAVKDAIDAGYRHFDTAHLYQNEAPIGRGLRAKIKEGVVKREEIFVTTKLWCTNFKPELVIGACRRSNNALGLGYIDLYLMHAPIAMPLFGDDILFPKDLNGKGASLDIDYLDTYKKMEECVYLGLCKSIGVSNFNSQQLDRVIANARIKPVNNQIECCIALNQRKLIDFCKKRNVLVTAFCPLGRPNPVNKTPSFLYDEKLVEISKKYNKTPAQIALRYCIELGTVPLPKSVHKNRIVENINVFDFQLTEQEMRYLDTLHTGERLVNLREYRDHKYFPFKIEY